MPIYEFKCSACDHVFERLQKLSDADPTDCPECGAAQVRRQLTAPAFRLAGSGWYETDFKKDSDKKSNLATKDDAPKSESSSSDSSKSDSSKSEKSDSGKSDAGKTESATAETPKSDGAKSGSSKPEARASVSKPAPAAKSSD